jgi:hypothetical protein
MDENDDQEMRLEKPDDDSVEERLKTAGIVEAPDGGFGWVNTRCPYNTLIPFVIGSSSLCFCK